MSQLGQHPSDRLIGELIASRRAASAEEIAQIVERMATAPFSSRVVRVPMKERGAAYQGQILTARAPSLVYHLVKRVVIEEQWARGTTAARYLADLAQAVRNPAARLVIYERRGQRVAATITPTGRVIPATRLGIDALPELLVVYSADSSMIVTGYQFSRLDQTGVPGEALWLK
ncbi:MAG TPA: hypothetical protein VFE37_08630 [Chloroflexota bacterium]|nr:hypothetical protein [Chloroflexota bacterium]